MVNNGSQCIKILQATISIIISEKQWDLLQIVLQKSRDDDRIRKSGALELLNSAVAVAESSKTEKVDFKQLSNFFSGILDSYFSLKNRITNLELLYPVINRLLLLMVKQGQGQMALDWIQRLERVGFSPSPTVLYECVSISEDQTAAIRKFKTCIIRKQMPSISDVICFAKCCSASNYYNLLYAISRCISNPKNKLTGPLQIEVVKSAAKQLQMGRSETHKLQAAANLGSVCRKLSQLKTNKNINKDALSIAIVGLCKKGFLVNGKRHMQWLNNLGLQLEPFYVRQIVVEQAPDGKSNTLF